MLIDLTRKHRVRPLLETLEDRAVPALFVTQTITQPTITVGDTVTINITVTNAGPNILTNASVTDDLPIGFKPLSGTAPYGVNIAGNTVFGQIGYLDIGQIARVTITARAELAGDYFDDAAAIGNPVSGAAAESGISSTKAITILAYTAPPPDTGNSSNSGGTSTGSGNNTTPTSGTVSQSSLLTSTLTAATGVPAVSHSSPRPTFRPTSGSNQSSVNTRNQHRRELRAAHRRLRQLARNNSGQFQLRNLGATP